MKHPSLAIVLMVAALTVAAHDAHAQCPLSFAPAVNYAVGTSPRFVVVGDFNGDGRPDLVVANSNIPFSTRSTVSILLGNANGTFQGGVSYPVGIRPLSVAVGDFNADGRPDLAVANSGSANVSILLGNGGGTFQAAVSYAVGTTPPSVAVGDFNADGRLDLAVANYNSNTVSILLGNTNGTFQAAVNFAVGVRPNSVAVGDFNADGRPDLAVANQTSDNVSILLGNANGTFQGAVNYPVNNGPVSVAVGDFNADGRPDLAVANGDSSAYVSILRGNANGTFQAAVDYAAASRPYSVAVGDFNADGRPDLAVANAGSANASVRLNTTPNAVVVSQQPAPVSTCPSGTATFSVTAAGGGGGPFTYQWQWQPASGAAFVDVIDGLNTDPQGGLISFVAAGARTATVSTESYGGSGTAASHWDMRCIVFNAGECGSVTSNPATLTICPADFNCDGATDFFDYDDFVVAFETGDSSADFDHDGTVDFFDYDAFVVAFETPC